MSTITPPEWKNDPKGTMKEDANGIVWVSTGKKWKKFKEKKKLFDPAAESAQIGINKMFGSNNNK